MVRRSITITPQELPGTVGAIARDLGNIRSLLRHFTNRHLRNVQQRHAVRDSWGGVSLSPLTVKKRQAAMSGARSRGRGYYRKWRPNPLARPAHPPAVWTGNFLSAVSRWTNRAAMASPNVRRLFIDPARNYGIRDREDRKIPHFLMRWIRRKGGRLWDVRRLNKGLTDSIQRHVERVARRQGGGP